MNVNNKYTDNELHLMSYQELRRLSILLELPANIKKKYMISMIQAHQKGDGCTKIAIANKIMEERKVKKLSTKGKQAKSFMLSTSPPNQQIPTDLSLATKHEFETRFSYVAHYTAKDNITSGISRIIKQEAEVSRRNRSIIHQTRKPTRKLSTVGRTEIMLPRNHSLTTPVRLMPQSERGYLSPNEFEKGPGMPNVKGHYPDANYNCHFHGEYSNAMMQSTTHEMYKSEPYWPTREVYNSSLMPILSSLLTTNPDSINSSVYASQYTSQNILKAPSSFQQGVYEKYIKNGSMVESQGFQTNVSNTSTMTVNSHYYNDSNNNYNASHGCRSYIVTKNDVDFEINSTMNEIDCQHYARRDNTVIRNTSESQGCVVDFYLPRNSDPIDPHVEDLSQCNAECFKSQGKTVITTPSHRAFNISPVTPHENTEQEPESTPAMTAITDYESVYIEDKFWEDPNNRDKKLEKDRAEKENYAEGFLNVQPQSSLFSEVSENSNDFSLEVESSDPLAKSSKEHVYAPLNFSRCRYVLGHNKYPEIVSGSSSPVTLPSFLSTFSTSGVNNKAYSICRNSFTGTTEAHLNPIMTCTYVSQFAPHSNPQPSHSTSPPANSLIQRQWLYSYPEPQAPFSVESTTYTSWDEYSDMGNKIIAHNNGHEVQVVKCRKHGCHYLYSISNPCD